MPVNSIHDRLPKIWFISAQTGQHVTDLFQILIDSQHLQSRQLHSNIAAVSYVAIYRVHLHYCDKFFIGYRRAQFSIVVSIIYHNIYHYNVAAI